jgi:hypothetical protein
MRIEPIQVSWQTVRGFQSNIDNLSALPYRSQAVLVPVRTVWRNDRSQHINKTPLAGSDGGSYP